MKKVASIKTLNKSKKTRSAYAYSAIERAMFNDDEKIRNNADDAFERWANNTMTKEEMIDWALSEIEHRELN